jgi:hypothetical protein
MWHLTDASDIPTILMMQGVADFALHHAAWIIALDFFEAIWAAVFLINRQLNIGFALQGIPSPGAQGAGRSGGPVIFRSFYPRPRG